MWTRWRIAAGSQRWLGLGALLALGWSARGVVGESLLSLCDELSGLHSAPSADGTLWICDRDAQTLVALTGDGLVRARVAVRYPLELEPGREGRLWLLYALAPGPAAETRLASLDPRGALRFDRDASGLRGLVACGAGSVAGLVELGSTAEVVRYSDGGDRRRLGRAECGSRLAASPTGELWLAGPTRLASFLPAGGGPRGVRRFEVPREFTALVWSAGRVWALVGAPEREQWLLGFDAWGATEMELPLSELGLRSGPALLTSGGAGGGVWLVSERGEALRLDAAGRPRARGSLPLPGIEALAAPGDGGLLALSAGALMRLDPRGQRVPGQGGLRFACDLVPAQP